MKDKQELAELRRRIEDLTPGGSEFVGDMDRCIEFIKRRMTTPRKMLDLQKRVAELEKFVGEQAEDEGLWFIAQTSAEAYLQQELRKLHRMVESGRSGEDG